jgi:hypothetical protein
LSYRNKKPKLCRGPSNEHSCLVWIQSDLFLRRRHLNISIGYNVNLCPAVAAILDFRSA